MKKRIVAMILLALMVVAGCTAVSLEEWLTPAEKHEPSVAYASKAGVIDSNDFNGYFNLAKQRQLDAAVRAAFELLDLSYGQMKEKNRLEFGILSEVMTRNTKSAETRGELMFGRTGLVSNLMIAGGFGSLLGVAGLMRKRPGDFTKDDVIQLSHDFNLELDEKETELFEVVAGVQEFLDTYKSQPDQPQVVELKAALAAKTSTGTKTTIGAIKAG